MGAALLLALCAIGPATAHAAEDQPAAEQAAITVTILGSGTPVPSATQAGPAILIEAGGEHFLFDCGRACTTRMAQSDPGLITSVHRLFLTHMHSDHLTGIDDLWLNGWVQGRKQPFSVYGPDGTAAMMEGLRTAFACDIAFRREEGIPGPGNGLDSDFHDLPSEGGTVYDADGVRITAFPVEHGNVVPAFGYRLEYGGHAVMLSGDTALTPNLFAYGEDADVVLLEVVSPALVDFLKKQQTPEQVDAIVSHHLTASQAALVFARVSPRLGVFYHTLNEGAFEASLIEQTREGYGGPLMVARDLMKISIGESISVTQSGEQKGDDP